MSVIGRLTQPEWTPRGIAFAAVSVATSDLVEVARLMIAQDVDGAHEVLGIIIRDLQAAQRML